MESALSNIKMEFVNWMDSTASGALWSPSFEADSFNTFVSESQGGAFTKITFTCTNFHTLSLYLFLDSMCYITFFVNKSRHLN